MFTGVIHHTGRITACEKKGDWRITVESDLRDVNIGDSVACNGCCLTVISIAPLPLREGLGGGVAPQNNRAEFNAPPPTQPSPSRGEGLITFSLSQETLARTAPRWEADDTLHLERAMKLGDTLDGHMVSGHVDGLATLTAITPIADSHRLTFEAPAELAKFIAAKGSVTLDGISLTVNEVEGNCFTVNIIPHTWQVTTFSKRAVGDKVNLEIDLIARYVARLLGK